MMRKALSARQRGQGVPAGWVTTITTITSVTTISKAIHRPSVMLD